MLHVRSRSECCIDLKRFSTWKKLVNTVAILYKFCKRLRKVSVQLLDLTTMSQNFIYSMIQYEAFKDEIAVIEANTDNLPKSSPLYKCSPYIDDCGVLRIKGRIDLGKNIPESMKRPIILPKDNYGTKLIIQHYHEKFHHIHHETVLYEINQVFHIPCLRVQLKKIRNTCQKCKNESMNPIVPEMAQLPLARLAAFSRPFTSDWTTLDLFELK